MVLEPHYEGYPGANALAPGEADSGEGFEDAGLAGGLVSDDYDRRKLDAFLHDFELPEFVNSVKEWPDPVIV